MRLVQFEIPGEGRRVGIVEDDLVLDLTAPFAHLDHVYAVFLAARSEQLSLGQYLQSLVVSADLPSVPYETLLASRPGGDDPFLHPPLDHPDPYRVLVSGTGLTHTGGMKSRDQMHAEGDEAPQTDSAKMFAMGLEDGDPEEGRRGAMPEWFYKGNGHVLRGPGGELDLPTFALDGGEEPELVGCYIVDEEGIPRRLGFALGIEWSDHETERINYLYLAPSKLRTCGVGPELVTDCDFRDVSLSCSVTRDGEVIYDSGELFSGEEHMCHSLANCEDHHFKYSEHRRPGDVHLHFFGTSKLSFGSRDWKYQSGDEVRVESESMGGPLTMTVVASAPESLYPIRAEPA